MRNKPTAANLRSEAGNRWPKISHAQWNQLQRNVLIINTVNIKCIRFIYYPILLEFSFVNLTSQMGLGQRSKLRLLSHIPSARRLNLSLTSPATPFPGQTDRQTERITGRIRTAGLTACQFFSSLPLSLSFSQSARRFASTHYVNFNFPHKNKLFLLDVGNTFQHMQRVWHAHHAILHVCVSVCVCESTCHAGIVSIAFEFPQLSAFPVVYRLTAEIIQASMQCSILIFAV